MRCMNKIPASTNPTSMASTRSKATVMPMVTNMVLRSLLVERKMACTAYHSTIRTTTTIRIPARAAKGIACASGPSSNTTRSKKSA